MSDELALVESHTLRQKYRDRTDALGAVPALAQFMSGGPYTLAQVAAGYAAKEATIRKLCQTSRHGDELTANGMRHMTAEEGIGHGVPYLSPAKMPWVFTPRAVLNVGMLLTDNDVARMVRSTLLDVVVVVAQDVMTELEQRALRFLVEKPLRYVTYNVGDEDLMAELWCSAVQGRTKLAIRDKDRQFIRDLAALLRGQAVEGRGRYPHVIKELSEVGLSVHLTFEEAKPTLRARQAEHLKLIQGGGEDAVTG